MKPDCAVCKQKIGVLEEKVFTDDLAVHKRCLKCALCNAPITPDSHAMDKMIAQHFGPVWFCPTHNGSLSRGEKFEKMRQKYGDPKRTAKEATPAANGATAAAVKKPVLTKAASICK